MLAPCSVHATTRLRLVLGDEIEVADMWGPCLVHAINISESSGRKEGLKRKRVTEARRQREERGENRTFWNPKFLRKKGGKGRRRSNISPLISPVGKIGFLNGSMMVSIYLLFFSYFCNSIFRFSSLQISSIANPG